MGVAASNCAIQTKSTNASSDDLAKSWYYLLRTGYTGGKTIPKRFNSLEQMKSDCCSISVGPNYPISCMTDIIPSAMCKIPFLCTRKFSKVLIWIKACLNCPGKVRFHERLKAMCRVIDNNYQDMDAQSTS